MPMRTAGLARWVCLCLVVAGCSRESSPPAPVPAPPPAAAAPQPDSSVPHIVVLGDSLTAGLGLSQSEAYPALLQEKLNAAGYKWEVVNAGVSGDTSAAGLQRVDWALDQGP